MRLDLKSCPAHLGNPRSGIIFAADLPDYDANARVLERIADQIDAIKVNVPLLYIETPAVIRRLSETFQLPVFADLKIADVPHTNNKIVRIAADNGAKAVMVHGLVGPDALEDAIDAGGDDLGVIVQLELTNPGGQVFSARLADEMAELAGAMGVYGVQAPGNRPERIASIRNIVGPEPVIVCCGVGHQGGQLSEVLSAGGTWAIIGRAIYTAEDPRAMVLKIIADSRLNSGEHRGVA